MAGTIAAPVGAVLAIGGPIATTVGGALGYSAIGFFAGSGMVAADKYAQSGTVGPVQSLFAGTAAAVATPMAEPIMKLKLFTAVFQIFFLCGCGAGGFWMTGNPSAGMNIKPLVEYWEENVWNAEKRNRDWMECGGMRDGGYSSPKSGVSAQEMRDAAGEKYMEIQRCMLRNGYRYTGSCEGSIRQAYPACKAQ
ncbi:hypothetical protein [Cupriavidus sp. SK-3]|uniref:hypothetical protein n=1 Tax=Cupriavidus sp. SK-3 TaxID=1470558 RepID=UPI001F2925D6|nr:hypothetical protein [Cupriavidus sp. SK-3]